MHLFGLFLGDGVQSLDLLLQLLDLALLSWCCRVMVMALTSSGYSLDDNDYSVCVGVGCEEREISVRHKF
jgi:hypothetical protein